MRDQIRVVEIERLPGGRSSAMRPASPAETNSSRPRRRMAYDVDANGKVRPAPRPKTPEPKPEPPAAIEPVHQAEPTLEPDIEIPAAARSYRVPGTENECCAGVTIGIHIPPGYTPLQSNADHVKAYRAERAARKK